MARGKPIITLRLDQDTIISLRICASVHGLTVSDLIRQLIDEQLERDKITPTAKPLDGQISM